MNKFIAEDIVPSYVCQYCKKTFRIRSLRKDFKKRELNDWFVRARCPYCGKKVRKKLMRGGA